MSKEQLRDHAKRSWTTYFEEDCTSLQMPAAELTQCTAAPTQILQALGNDLEGFFFLFLSKKMWVSIASECNRYQLQYRTQAADVIMTRQKRINQRRPVYKIKSLQQIQKEQRAFKPTQPHELVSFIGLLCARAPCPHREKLAKHWAVKKAF
ncbi:hypothetical protein PPTG_21681 [Phytophthora nicotianae INRA-310]|uniref:PiggyBac transposable element-derived protein domain-containing protein n=1 Tax=Phytophthora nicotianae (strain INRA-310) TaxID=761204 RepID=W2QZM4_PHYN3|nr:hypothetical protein PPTG_21681 [Phytophthora nicotianae INRA-310]ETN17715.1 hypothetical protein PPTG_21681 [Phytophthora nicotianae INRA-310]